MSGSWARSNRGASRGPPSPRRSVLKRSRNIRQPCALRAARSNSKFPRVLDADQHALVVTLTDLIIPETDTPGAKGAHVDQFIDVMLADWYDADDRQRFLDGLAEVDARSTAATGKAFVDTTPAQQTT